MENRQHGPTRVALAGATFNLLNTILGGGGGIVPLPRCIRLTGLRLAPVLLLFCAALSAYNACAIVAASCAVRESTYQGVAMRTLGVWGALTVQVLVVSLTFGISVAVIDIFADIAPSMLNLSRTTTVMLAGCAVMPIVTLIRRIERLSIISVAASLLVAAFVVFVCLCAKAADNPRPTPEPSPTNLLEAISIVNLSFLCHFNLLPLFQSLPGAPAPHVRTSMYQVIVIATLLALAVYGIVGILGFVAFGEHTSGNAFADYAANGGYWGRVLNYSIATAQLLSLPLLVHEGVRELVGLLGMRGQLNLSEHHGLLSPQALARVDSDGNLVHLAGGGSAQESARGERLCGMAWCVSATCIALYAADTSKVLALVAALCGAPLMSVLPVLMLLRSGHDLGPRGVALNVALLVLGVAVSGASAMVAVRAIW